MVYRDPLKFFKQHQRHQHIVLLDQVGASKIQTTTKEVHRYLKSNLEGSKPKTITSKTLFLPIKRQLILLQQAHQVIHLPIDHSDSSYGESDGTDLLFKYA